MVSSHVVLTPLCSLRPALGKAIHSHLANLQYSTSRVIATAYSSYVNTVAHTQHVRQLSMAADRSPGLSTSVDRFTSRILPLHRCCCEPFRFALVIPALDSTVFCTLSTAYLLVAIFWFSSWCLRHGQTCMLSHATLAAVWLHSRRVLISPHFLRFTARTIPLEQYTVHARCVLWSSLSVGRLQCCCISSVGRIDIWHPSSFTFHEDPTEKEHLACKCVCCNASRTLITCGDVAREEGLS